MDNYYIDLILSKCVSLKKRVFISYNVYNEPFINKLVAKLKRKGIKDIYLNCIDPFYEHDLLQKLSLKEIEDSHYFDQSIYNEYAKKGAAFIFFDSPIPGIFDDIDCDKLQLVSKIKSTTKKEFVNLEIANKISWTIVPLYNKYWEENLGINNLEKILYKICLVNKHYLKNWNKQIKLSKRVSNKLNKLKLDYLYYENSLGTKLKVGLPKDYFFESVGDTKVLVNMPSYEVFTSPHRLSTEGIVYSSKPLFYNGTIIDEFYLKFKNGKVVEFDAKKGKSALASIINFDDGSAYLGECALVEVDSPISKTNIIFKTTLLDENASCHLALGRGFGSGSKARLLKKGINFSDIHVDFMIGTKDLNITGYKNGKSYLIMKNGKFTI